MNKRVKTKEELVKVLSPEHQNIYYVYICEVEGVVRYVGMGKGKRFEHCKSGKSSCPELNRDFHAGLKMDVEKVKEKLTHEDAQSLECELLRKYEGLYNKRFDYDLSSTPNVKRMKSVKIIAQGWDKKIIGTVCSLSPDILEYDFKEIKRKLSSCGLDFFLVQFGDSKPVLVIDKPEHTDAEIRHLGCLNWPNCDVAGCGG